MIDRTTLDTWSDDELEQAAATINQEKQRRYTLKTAEKQMDRLTWQYSVASGRDFGGEWTQPVGGHDAYPKNYRVIHRGKEWVSLITANVWEPGTSGWREYVEPGSGVVPEYIAPTGAHDAYMVGDRVTFRGRVYESVIDSNVYSPEEYSRGWVEIDPNAPVEEPEVPGESEPEPDPDPDPDPDPEVPVDSEPEPEPEPEVPSVPAWKQPTGGHDTYNAGDRVLFEGSVYESVINGNSWSPTGYPAGWKKI